MGTERQRDAEMDRLLRDGMGHSTHGEVCPEADMLAAFVEGGVSADERAALDAHFAACHRCQEALAAFALAMSPHEPAARPTPAPWWSFSHWHWAVPVAAAAVIILYVAVRPVIAPEHAGSAPASFAAAPPAEPPATAPASQPAEPRQKDE